MQQSIEKGLAALRRLDLSQVRRKLQEPAPEGKGWSEEFAENAEIWYRRYLEVCLRRPELPAVPNRIIDDFWHQHILDTIAYAKDCQELFGKFLHHYPYYGLNGDAEARDQSFAETNALYRELFGADCTENLGSDPHTTTGSSCNGKGSGTGCSRKGVGLFSASNCGDKGSGTGCSRRDVGATAVLEMEPAVSTAAGKAKSQGVRCDAKFTKPG